jgi:glycosyltransferase involved in cell wall biosynthesis
MNNNPILSILIPTKNRQKYALNVVQHILGIANDRLQLIIQDNSDSNSLGDALSIYKNDSRLRYYYHNEVLSFVDNFSLGLRKCTGEYVTIIGDDDGINPLIIEITEWAHKYNIEAISSVLSIIYFWPDSGVNYANNNGMLTIRDTSCKVKYVDTKKEVKKFLKNGCHNYLNYNLAKAYHGIVKRSVLENIKSKTGNFIGGLSPDIYLSIAISLLVDKVLIVDYPLTISGICNQSGSSDSATGKHTGALNKAPHFIGHKNYKWAIKIPPFYSVDTIWGDSALAAINDLNEIKYLKYFRDYILCIYCLNSFPKFKEIIISTLVKNHNYFNLSLKIILLKGRILVFYKTFINKLIFKLRRKQSNQVHENVGNMLEASDLCQTIIFNKSKILLDNIMKTNT